MSTHFQRTGASIYEIAFESTCLSPTLLFPAQSIYDLRFLGMRLVQTMLDPPRVLQERFLG